MPTLPSPPTSHSKFSANSVMNLGSWNHAHLGEVQVLFSRKTIFPLQNSRNSVWYHALAMHVTIEPGNLIRHRGRLYFVEQVTERHKGQQKPVINVGLRDALDDHHRFERTLDELEPIDYVPHALRPMQYLYARGRSHVFLDNESYEEVELSGPPLGGFEPFLKEGSDYKVFVADDKPLRLQTEPAVELEVKTTAAPSHGGSSGGAGGGGVLKEAILENGLMVRVPLFIKNGDLVKVDTRNREYLGKAGK